MSSIERGVNTPPTQTPMRFAMAPGWPTLTKQRSGTRIAAGQVPLPMIWSLPVISYSSLTLTCVFDHLRSYHPRVRMRRKAACDFSPWASAGPADAMVKASPAARPTAQSLPAWRVASRASLVNIVVFIAFTLPHGKAVVILGLPLSSLGTARRLDGLHVFYGGEHLPD